MKITVIDEHWENGDTELYTVSGLDIYVPRRDEFIEFNGNIYRVLTVTHVAERQSDWSSPVIDVEVRVLNLAPRES